jgi:hypothetical protein
MTQIDQTLYREFAQFNTAYLPDLNRFVMPIVHRDDKGRPCIGSGVWTNVQGRHLVATAKHCIQHDPYLIRNEFFIAGNQIRADDSLPIRSRGWADDLDIGYLEVEPHPNPELHENQLCSDRIVTGYVHVIGHPRSEMQVDQARREISMFRCAFGTTLLEDTDSSLKFAYPRDGVRPNATTGIWENQPFPEAFGFSGGGCFGVAMPTGDGVVSIQYNLLGIQSSWHPGERWVRVMPIKKWRELVSDQLKL